METDADGVENTEADELFLALCRELEDTEKYKFGLRKMQRRHMILEVADQGKCKIKIVVGCRDNTVWATISSTYGGKDLLQSATLHNLDEAIAFVNLKYKEKS